MKTEETPVYDFTLDDHATMLGDAVRLDDYHAAIKELVHQGMRAVEIGTGTGILSAFAAAHTQAEVVAIENYPKSALLAESMFKSAGLHHVRVINSKSNDVQLDPEPDVLITETIGAIGPEEHTVEICFDFVKRHPKIRTLIPSRLQVFAEPIQSKHVLDLEKIYLDYFDSASYGRFDFAHLKPELKQNWASLIRYTNLHDSVSSGETVLVADYQFGTTETSAFQKIIQFAPGDPSDAVHFYFKAHLSPHVILSTHYSKMETHWRHAFVRKPQGVKELWVSYANGFDTVRVHWVS